jgi:HD-GYP domain-containing protein (c-di-GMP phosphodiesterase class II)
MHHSEKIEHTNRIMSSDFGRDMHSSRGPSSYFATDEPIYGSGSASSRQTVERQGQDRRCNERRGSERREESPDAALLHLRERQINAMQQLGSALFGLRSVDEIVRETLKVAIGVLNAQVGSLQLYDPANDTLVFRHAVDEHNAEMLIGLSVPATQGINSRVFHSGEPLITNQIPEEGDWNRDVDEKTGFHTRNMLTVPLKQPDGKTLGVIQVLNGRRPFDRYDMEVLQVMCSQAAHAIDNARLSEESERLAEESARSLAHLQALRHIDHAITSSLDLSITLGVFVEQVIAQLRAGAAAVLLLDSEHQELKLAAHRGYSADAKLPSVLKLTNSFAGEAALEHRIVRLDLRHGQAAERIQHEAPHLLAESFAHYHAVPLIAKGEVKGVLEVFHRRAFEPDEEWLQFLETLAGSAAIAIDNAQLFTDLEESNLELMRAYDTTINGWSRALDLRDKETEGHTQRVTEMTVRLAHAMGIPDEEMTHVRRGALLHDIGKMGIPDSILLKPGPLDEEEWAIMKCHPTYALDLLKPIKYLHPALDIPYCHHEKWDGSGYPQGLKGEGIPLCARIFAVIDVWDALRSDRPYRQGWSEERVRAHIRNGSGSHFDPAVVDAFERVMDEVGEPK